MTFSILARDPGSNAIGGAAATGSLCVGGWVLRGVAGVGMSASQGKAPSTLWGERVLDYLKSGKTVEAALNAVVAADSGSAQRQLSVIDGSGAGAAFSGDQNTPEISQRRFPGGMACGNMLAYPTVIDALVDEFLDRETPFAERLLASLRAADEAGSDIRGLQSAALLIVSPDHPPLSLRIDFSMDPLAALEDLFARATSGDYAAWADQVPTLSDPERKLD